MDTASYSDKLIWLVAWLHVALLGLPALIVMMELEWQDLRKLWTRRHSRLLYNNHKPYIS